MSKTRVGVLRGGESKEYEISLRSGANILRHLPQTTYTPVDILLSRKGEWIIDGLISDIDTVLHRVDIIWNSLHGEFGEDGKAQHLLERFRVPYTGSGVVPSLLAFQKHLAKEEFAKMGVRSPKGVLIRRDDEVEESIFQIFKSYAFPLIIKPTSQGSSLGILMAKTFDELVSGVHESLLLGDVLVEEYIRGKEATVVVVDTSENGHIALAPVEISLEPGKEYFDYDAKYFGKGNKICPGNFTLGEINELRALATKIHAGFGLKHYSQSDFIVSPRGIYALEVNTLPGTGDTALLPLALKTAGVELSEFIEHILELSLQRKKT